MQRQLGCWVVHCVVLVVVVVFFGFGCFLCFFFFFPEAKRDKFQWDFFLLYIWLNLLSKRHFFLRLSRWQSVLVINIKIFSKLNWLQICLYFENALELIWLLQYFFLLVLLDSIQWGITLLVLMENLFENYSLTFFWMYRRSYCYSPLFSQMN